MRPTPQPPSVGRARAAVSALFLTNGALYANILPRYPEIKQALGLDNAEYGFAVIAFPVGAIVAGLGAAWAIRRLGSARAAVFSTILTALGVLAAGLAPNVWVFVGFLLVGGACDAITDVAQNAHGLRVQRAMGRSILNSFHAVWSVGAVLGGAMAAGAIAVGLPIGVHLAISGAIFCVVALVALRYCLPGPDRDPTPDGHAAASSGAEIARRVPARVVLTLIALVVIAMAGSVVEDAGFTWAALYLTSLGAPGAIAATGLIALVGAQFVGRLVGDRLVDRFGQRAVARAGGLLVVVGMGVALALGTVSGSIVGFAAAGLGIATLVPAAMHAADELPGLRHGTGLTVVSWLMRLGFLASPPAVGLIANATDLRTALAIVPCAGLAVIVLAGVLDRRRENARR
ncbi:MFS transporter [Microbacterium excoecariae]|uniref:MFS transporter n=1 Tax=Microbacterium excoecariae TaxID=2715210 RepID=UPI00140D7724|nr:MFS transporter [Microbacterium excoecariae]NHI16631.1 MFS transporter [Microbacterium excoecariae]